MAHQNADNDLPLRELLAACFSRSKFWWGLGLIAQIVASLAGAVSVLTSNASLQFAIIIGLVSSLASASTWRSESLRARAESLLRHLEFKEGFGWPIEPKILADNLSRRIFVSETARRRARQQGTLYYNQDPPGATKALHNLRESSWWSEQISHWMAQLSTVMTLVVLLVCLWSLLVSASLLGATGPLELSNVLTAFIALAFTGNLIKLPVDYFKFAKLAQEFDQKASHYIQVSSITERDVLRLLTDYQLARSTAPFLPDWAWKIRKNELNQIWSKYRGSA